MATILPNSINYDEQMQQLSPQTKKVTQVIKPVNGSLFTQNQQIILDMDSRSFIDPQSIYIRYKFTVTSIVGTPVTVGYSCSVLGTPVYTPIIKIDTYFNNKLVDSILDYNLIANSYINMNFGVSEKYANQVSYGYLESSLFTEQTMDTLDGRYLFTIADTVIETRNYTVAAPLICT